MQNDTRQTFNRHCEDTLNECLAIQAQRGGEYQDSWSLENQITPFFDQVLRTLGVTMTSREKRALIMAGMIDVKLSRLQGAPKGDTYQDLINYVAVHKAFMEELVESLKQPVTFTAVPQSE